MDGLWSIVVGANKKCEKKKGEKKREKREKREKEGGEKRSFPRINI